MQVLLNGETCPLALETTISQLLAALNLGGRRVAVEINAEIIPRSEHTERHLKPHDKIEIIHAVGGG